MTPEEEAFTRGYIKSLKDIAVGLIAQADVLDKWLSSDEAGKLDS